MGEEYAGAGMIEVKGFEAEFDGWKYSWVGRGVIRGTGYSSIFVGIDAVVKGDWRGGGEDGRHERLFGLGKGSD